jgi:2-dehydropantoate 2-reductase
MKIGIIGPGAMGCLFAGIFADSGNDVWLLDYNLQRSKYLVSNGITIQGLANKKNIKVHSTIQQPRAKDLELIIISVKSYDTESAVKYWLQGVQNTIILTLQNGIGNVEIIQKYLEKNMLFAGTTSEGATLLETGSVNYAGRGKTVFGCISGAGGDINKSISQKILDVFKNAGFQTEITQRVQDTLWTKLVINTGINALTAILKVKNGNLLKSEYAMDIMSCAVKETVAVGTKIGIQFLFSNMVKKTHNVAQLTQDNRSSMLQDVLAKRRTEIDAINGAVVRYAQQVNIQVPVNTFLWKEIKALESLYKFQVL